MLKAIGTCTLMVLLLFSIFSIRAELPWVKVSPSGVGFVASDTQKPFSSWGFNYDHDAQGRLIEDYWDDEWDKVDRDFRDMKRLGANLVRIHLQFNQFVTSAKTTNGTNLDRLAKMLQLAEDVGLYLDLTGLGCYHKAAVPAWYDKLAEKERWDVQALFWEAIASRCANRSCVFCYNLMNEPVVPGGIRQPGDWLGPPFAGKHFVQFITLDQGNRQRPEIARQWARHLVTAIRKKDKRHMITVGLVDWSLDRPGLTSGFVPSAIINELDFISVHLYPKAGQVKQSLETLAGFAVGKPVLIEEIFPLRCSVHELEQFIEASKTHASGWVGFYWGQKPEELKRTTAIADKLTLAWLELFQRLSKGTRSPEAK